jgi:hypothetical protein
MTSKFLNFKISGNSTKNPSKNQGFPILVTEIGEELTGQKSFKKFVKIL